MNSDKKQLEISDVERNEVYKLYVSAQDFNRAMTDYQFANSLLIHARSNSNNKITGGNPASPNEETDLDEATEDSPNLNSHKLYVSAQDFNRAMTDYQFANSLLIHDRSNSNNKITGGNPASPNEETDLDEATEDSPDSLLSLERQRNEINIPNKNNWSCNETVCLIKSMESYYQDFSDPRKRKHIFEHITNDLISAGFAANSQMVQNKWKSLIRSYNKAKDTKHRTGQGPSRFLFYELIDEVIGLQPKNNCKHSLNTLENECSHNKRQATMENEIQDSQHMQSELVTGESSKEEGTVSNTNKKLKRMSKKEMRKKYIDLKTEEYKKHQKRHEDRLNIKRDKNEIEKQKLKLLEKYLESKKTD